MCVCVYGEGRGSGVGGTCIELEDSKMMAVFLSLPALFPQPGSGFLAVFCLCRAPSGRRTLAALLNLVRNSTGV